MEKIREKRIRGGPMLFDTDGIEAGQPDASE
jgi:hypothetical protein